jgi:hypothetical protein
MILAGPISAHRHRGANLSLSRSFPLAPPYNVIPTNSRSENFTHPKGQALTPLRKNSLLF